MAPMIRRPEDWQLPIGTTEQYLAYREAKKNRTKDYVYGFDFTPDPDGKDLYGIEKRILKYYPFFLKVKDGEDCLRKTCIISGYTGIAGTGLGASIGFSSIAVVGNKNPKVGIEMLRGMAKWGPPGFGLGGIYVATLCTVSHLRGGANDPWNHFCAGLACGSVFGTFMKSQKAGWGWGFALGIGAMIYKAGMTEGFLRHDRIRDNKQEPFLQNHKGIFIKRPDPRGSPDQRDFHEM